MTWDRTDGDDEMVRDREDTFARRKVHRSKPGLMMARLESEMADDLCLVSDISPRGAGLRTVRRHAVGDRVKLDFGDALAVAGTVRWSHDGQCGIEFDAVMDLSPLFRADRSHSAGMAWEPVRDAGTEGKARRGQPRLRRCATVVLQQGSRSFAGQLVDVSPAGARIDLADTAGLADGERVSFWVEDRFDCEGAIRWIGPQSVGVVFDPPLRMWKLEKWLVDAMDQCGTCSADSCAAPSFQRALIRRGAAGGDENSDGRSQTIPEA